MNQNTKVVMSDLFGIWKRDYLKTPDHVDDTTLVWWFQSELLHVDIRIPAKFGVADEWIGLISYSQLTDDLLRTVASVEGFAGTTDVDNSVCTWTRLINYRGKLLRPDTGLLEQTPDGLVESGIHAEYTELWLADYSTNKAVSDSQVPTGVMMQSSDGTQCLIFIYTKTRFAFGRGRPSDLNCSDDFAGRLEIAIADKNQAVLAELLDMEFCAGSIDYRGGIIEVSSNPFRIGAVAFENGAIDSINQELTVSTLDFYGTKSCVLFRCNG